MQVTTSSKTVELGEDLTGGEWLVPPIGFAICDDISQLPIECARNHGACALNRGMQSRTLGYAVGMSGTDWQIKSWPAMVLGGGFDGRWLTTIYFHMRSEYKPITARIMAYRNIMIKNIINLGEAANQRTASQITWHPCDSPTCPTFFSEFTKFNPLRNLLKFRTKLSFISWQLYMKSIKWELMPKVKKKSDKQRQRLDKVRKRDERATNKSEVSKTKKCVEKSNIPNKTEVHISNNNRDGTSYLSNGGESSSRNCAAIDSSNVPSEAQAIVDKYLQSQRDLADRAKKKYSDSHRVQGAASDMCNEKSVKEMRQQYNTEWKRRARSLAEFREYEQQSNNKVKMQMARKDLTYRDTERECNKKRKQMARKDTAYRDIEKERDKKSKTVARKDSEYRDIEKEWDKKSKMEARKDSEYRDIEKERDKNSKKVARKDTLYRDNERQCNKKRMEIARKDTLYGDNERQCNRKSMQLARKDSGYRDKERQCNKKSMQMARKNPVQRNIERACNKKSMQVARKGPAYRKNERECNKIRMNMARINPEYRQNEQQCDTNRKKTMRNKQISLDDLIKNFHKEVEKGPVHKCCICDQLWYRHSVVILQSSSLPDCPALDACVSDIKQSEGKKLICNTCLSHLKKKKFPQVLLLMEWVFQKYHNILKICIKWNGDWFHQEYHSWKFLQHLGVGRRRLEGMLLMYHVTQWIHSKFCLTQVMSIKLYR